MGRGTTPFSLTASLATGPSLALHFPSSALAHTSNSRFLGKNGPNKVPKLLFAWSKPKK